METFEKNDWLSGESVLVCERVKLKWVTAGGEVIFSSKLA